MNKMPRIKFNPGYFVVLIFFSWLVVSWLVVSNLVLQSN